MLKNPFNASHTELISSTKVVGLDGGSTVVMAGVKTSQLKSKNLLVSFFEKLSLLCLHGRYSVSRGTEL